MSRFRVALIVCTGVVLSFYVSLGFAKDEPTKKVPESSKDETSKKMPSSVIPAEKDRKRHDQFLKDKAELLKKGPIEVVFVGDSITDGWRGQKGAQIWKKNFGEKYNALNLGIGGDRTQHVLWRIAHGELDGLKPKAVVIMIGTNNQQSPADEIITGVKAVVSAVHKKLPEAKILLLAIFPRDAKPTDARRVKVNDANKGLVLLDGNENVKYLDIGAKFLDKDGMLSKTIMPDYLHPNDKGYAIWADAINPTLEELVK